MALGGTRNAAMTVHSGYSHLYAPGLPPLHYAPGPNGSSRAHNTQQQERHKAAARQNSGNRVEAYNYWHHSGGFANGDESSEDSCPSHLPILCSTRTIPDITAELRKHVYQRTLGYGTNGLVALVDYHSGNGKVSPVAVKMVRCESKAEMAVVEKELLPLIDIAIRLKGSPEERHLVKLLHYIRVGWLDVL
jgi:hypothetical protein